MGNPERGRPRPEVTCPTMGASSPPDWYLRLSRALTANDLAAARALLPEIREEEGRVRERLEMLSSASFEGILVHVDGEVIDANQRLCEMLGYQLTRCWGRTPSAVRGARGPGRGSLQRMASHYEGEYVITGVRKDGSRFRAELLSKQGHIGDRPVRVSAVRDVTDRERTQALLRESEQRFRALARAAFDFSVFTRDGIIVDVDGDSEPVLGVTREQMLGRPLLDFTAPSAQPLVRQRMQEGQLGPYEAMGLHASGEGVPVLCVVTTTTLNGQPVRAAGVRDLRPVRRLEAERRALEQRLERAQRLDSLGVLAGGIAHDFNNLLVGVLGNAELSARGRHRADEREMADAIVTAAQRAAALTRQMLAYTGQRDLAGASRSRSATLLRELRGLLGATLSKKARLELTIEPGSVVARAIGRAWSRC